MINVPATTANLGPGFDSFGFALDVWNRVTVQKSDKFEMLIEGEGKDRIQLTEDNLVVQCVGKVRPSGWPVTTVPGRSRRSPETRIVAPTAAPHLGDAARGGRGPCAT